MCVCGVFVYLRVLCVCVCACVCLFVGNFEMKTMQTAHKEIDCVQKFESMVVTRIVRNRKHSSVIYTTIYVP